MVTSSPPTSAPGTDKTGMDFRRILPEIRCQSCLSPGWEPTPRGGFSTLSAARQRLRCHAGRPHAKSAGQGFGTAAEFFISAGWAETIGLAYAVVCPEPAVLAGKHRPGNRSTFILGHA